MDHLESKIIMTQTELAAGLTALKTQLGKVAKEQSDRFDALTKTIADLQAVIDAGGTIGTEVVDAVNAVKAAVQALDDVVPDAPTT